VTPRILAVLEAGDVFPSGFIRSLIYRDHFARHGYDVEYRSRLYPPLRRFIEAPPGSFAPAVGPLLQLERPIAACREWSITRVARDYDVVYMSKIASRGFVRALRHRTKARLVLDFGDALWLPNRGIPGFNEILQTVDAVTSDNELTAAYVRKHRADCTVIPDCPQVESFDLKRSQYRKEPGDSITIGWVGTPGTTYNLFAVWEALERLFGRHGNLHLRLLGANRRALPPFERVKWSLKPRYTQAEMIEEVLKMDIGIFPLQDVQASHVRGVLKASVYMAGGAAVVASPVGLTPALVKQDETGLLAATTGEWEEALDRLVREPETRRRLADTGLGVVRAELTVDRAFQKLIRVLDPPKSEEVNLQCVS
jgi:glycosyltransferase involved in cell wall biosynthesis